MPPNHVRRRNKYARATHFMVHAQAQRMLLELEALEFKLLRLSEPEAAADAKWAQILVERIVGALRPYLPMPKSK